MQTHSTYKNPYFTRKRGTVEVVPFNRNSPVKPPRGEKVEYSEHLRETLPRSKAPEPTSETPIYFHEQSASKESMVHREYETPSTKKIITTSVKKSNKKNGSV